MNATKLAVYKASHQHLPAPDCTSGQKETATFTAPCEGRKCQGMPSFTSALNVTVSSRAAAASSVAASGFSRRARILSSTVCSARKRWCQLCRMTTFVNAQRMLHVTASCRENERRSCLPCPLQLCRRTLWPARQPRSGLAAKCVTQSTNRLVSARHKLQQSPPDRTCGTAAPLHT